MASSSCWICIWGSTTSGCLPLIRFIGAGFGDDFCGEAVRDTSKTLTFGEAAADLAAAALGKALALAEGLIFVAASSASVA